MKLSIIIVNFNGKHHLQSCLQSIVEYCLGLDYEVILVDNASSDGSCEFVERQYPWVKLIRSNENLGFARGNNLGACHSRGDLFLLLNNDTKLQKPLQPMISLFDECKSIGVAGAKMLSEDGNYRLSTGRFLSPFRMIKFSLLLNKKGVFRKGDFEKFEKRIWEVEWVEGSFLMTRKDIWLKLGGLDEGFFMYVEDVDYCKRVVDLGYKVVFDANVAYVHYGGYSVSRLEMLVFGYRRFLDRHFRGLDRYIGHLVLNIGLVARLVLFSGPGLWNPKYRARFKNCRKALRGPLLG